jgi:flagellar assembly protein FliH
LFSKKSTAKRTADVPIAEFHYRQLLAEPVAVTQALDGDPAPEPEPRGISPEVVKKGLAAERAAAIAETETRLRQEYDKKAQSETQRMTEALAHFAATQTAYFAKVEAEVVRLALSIAAKILHRESQVDPLLVTAMVQIALSRLRDGAAATLRVNPRHAARWTSQLASASPGIPVAVVSDVELAEQDCILETELGSVNFNLEVQLKEVEKGFLDVLAQRPVL